MSLEASDLTLSRLVPGKAFQLSFDLQNLTDKPTGKLEAHVTARGIITRTVKPFDSIPAYQTRKFTVDIKPGHAENFRKYPTLLEVVIRSGGRDLYTVRALLTAIHLRNPITSLVPPKGRRKVNIMIFGEFGSGKTSAILTMLSALAGKLILSHPKLGPIGGGAGHASTTYREIELTKVISIWDPWGASPSNYNSDEFKYMIQGALPKDWPMGKAPTLDDLADKATREQNKPDAVFFMVTQALAQDTEYMTRLRGWLSIVKRERPDLNPFIILSQIDQIDPQLRTNPTLENQLLQDKIMEVAANTGVPEMQIFPTVSYKVERENKDVIDRFALDILYTAASQASYLHTGGAHEF